MVCSRDELIGDLSIDEVAATCETYYVPEVHPDSPAYAPDSPIARDYSLWITTGDPQVLRKAYREMAAVSRRERSTSDSFRFRFRFAPEYLVKPSSGTRTERQVAAGFLAMAGVVLATQWNEIKQELFGSGVSDAVVQAVNEDTRDIRILKDHVEYVERMATKMTTSLAYTERYEQLEDQYNRLVGLKNECFDQYSYLYAGIDQLLTSRKKQCAGSSSLCPESPDQVESEGP